jgi:tetratricopeptide (TPR) repeat protein
MPNFGESRWITSEDVNVEHLLDIFTTIDPNSDSIWDACTDFIWHLYWHKKRRTILQPKIEGLPDDHNSKPGCLFSLSRLFYSLGNFAESKRVISSALKLYRERRDDLSVAQALRRLSDTNDLMDLPKEGIQQAKEALEIVERLGNATDQAAILVNLAWLLCRGQSIRRRRRSRIPRNQPPPGERRTIFGLQISSCSWRDIPSKGEMEKAIHHYELALGIASPFNWHHDLFSVHYKLAGLFRDEGRFGEAQAHIEHAKSHATDSAFNLGLRWRSRPGFGTCSADLKRRNPRPYTRPTFMRSSGLRRTWRAVESSYGRIEKELNRPVASGQPASNCELL